MYFPPSFWYWVFSTLGLSSSFSILYFFSEYSRSLATLLTRFFKEIQHTVSLRNKDAFLRETTYISRKFYFSRSFISNWVVNFSLKICFSTSSSPAIIISIYHLYRPKALHTFLTKNVFEKVYDHLDFTCTTWKP